MKSVGNNYTLHCNYIDGNGGRQLDTTYDYIVRMDVRQTSIVKHNKVEENTAFIVTVLMTSMEHCRRFSSVGIAVRLLSR